MSTCKHCTQEIEFVETSIDDFWAHVNGLMTCADGKNEAWPEGVEEPPPFELTLKIVDSFRTDVPGFSNYEGNK